MTTSPIPGTEDTQLPLPWYPPGMKRAAIYARVSTVDRGQDPETQLHQLREYANRRGFGITEEFVDRASGTRSDRERFRRLLEAARRRQFDVVLVWRYDRFARSMRELVNALEEFNEPRHRLHQLQRGGRHHDAAGQAPVRHHGLPGRVRALPDRRAGEGRHAAGKAQGKHTGRPPLPSTKRQQILELHRANPRRSLRSIAKEVKVAPRRFARSCGPSRMRANLPVRRQVADLENEA